MSTFCKLVFLKIIFEFVDVGVPTLIRKMFLRTQLQCSFFLTTMYFKIFKSLVWIQNNSDCGITKTLRVAMFGLERALYLEPEGLDLNLCSLDHEGDRGPGVEFLRSLIFLSPKRGCHICVDSCMRVTHEEGLVTCLVLTGCLVNFCFTSC